MAQQICSGNKFGYCKYCENSLFRHNNETCQDSECQIYSCEKRHPRNCKHFRNYGYCKFNTFCKYKHQKQIHIAENCDKIEKIEKKLQTMKNPKANRATNDDDLVKIKTLEEAVHNLKTNIKENEAIIANMSERINSPEDKFTDFYVKEVNAKFTEIDTKLKTIEKNSEKNILKCTECV